LTHANEELFKKTFENKKILVTGGLGFIGSNLAKALVPLGADVLLVDSLIPDYGGNLFNIADIKSDVTVNIADVRDENGMRYLVRDQDFLFNLAGQVSHLDSMVDPMTDLEINCRSQLSILEACRYVNPSVRIVYASTRQIYGKPVELPVSEDHPIRPTDVNGINKASGEMYHQIYADVYGLRTTSLRLTNTYGPRQLMKHNRQGFAGWFIRSVVLGEEILLFGDGEQKRDFNYVDDVVDAFLVAAAKPQAEGETFNLGATPPTSLRAFVELLYEVSGREPTYRLVPFPEERRRIDIGDFYADYSKIERTLGWSPKTTLADGVAKTIEFYREHIEHYLN
jgi:UDP-glucose 4-epimerase